MSDAVQHVLVTMTALGAASFIVRRVFMAVRPGVKRQPPCASCPAARHRGAAASSATAREPLERPHPLVIHRRVPQ